MKLLKSPERTALPADNPASPTVIIINDPATAQQLTHSIRQFHEHQHSPQPYKTVQNESRLQGLIRSEREILVDSWNMFASATRVFIGTMVSWLMWRIVVPLSVVIMLLVIAVD